MRVIEPPRRVRVRAAVKRVMPLHGHPSRAVLTGFACAIALGSALLMLPMATETGTSSGPVTALFTATSAVCVTGLIVESTPEYWSTFGEVVILALIQVGGLGIMTLASLLGLLVARRFGLKMQLTAQAETKTLGLGEVRGVVAGVLKISIAFEIAVAIIFAARLVIGYGESVRSAVYLGVFHAISAFNNAGFSLYDDSLERFVTDPWISVTIAVTVICGGIGFPVLFELGRRARSPRQWTFHTKITLCTTGVLLAIGFVFITAAEWSNQQTMGSLGLGGKLLSGFFMAVMPRTAGFNSLDVSEMNSATLLVTDVLMFIGGGSAGTAGGIKVTTFALLAFVIFAEIRGESSVHVLGRKLSAAVQRQALTIALIGVGMVMTATIALLSITEHTLDVVLFEVVSAFGTVGLSAGITGDLPVAGELIITALMFIGRLGPITAATALALRDRPRRYDFPEGRPIVG